MLILTVRQDEVIYIDGGRITVTSLGSWKLGFTCDKSVAVDRKEIHFRKVREKAEGDARKNKETGHES